jgi:hypothetical protein
MQFIKKVGWDNLAITVVVVACSITLWNLKRWGPTDVIVEDVVSYYSYLPATFIYDDVTLQAPNEKYQEYDHTFWLIDLGDGKQLIKTSMGMSIMYAPFFAIAHITALFGDAEPSGFSTPYRVALTLSSIFYLFLGLLYLKKILKQFFSEVTTAITLLFAVNSYIFHFEMV